MAARFDVVARQGEGRSAVQHTETYVAACQVLGYSHPDLTAHGSQVSDWYETEAGLDLHVLDDDCAVLWAAATATEEELATQRAQLAELAVAWRGPGADSAMQFLQRHCDAAAAVAGRVRAAADGCAALRDNLWQLIDGKVATATAIDDRRLAERAEWLAAAHAVTTGAGQETIYEEVIRRQVNPYVDNDIRTDWISVMRSTVTSVDASFDAVLDGLAALPHGCFQVPGDFGPSATATAAPVVGPPVVGFDAVRTVPAAAPSLPPTPPPAVPTDALEGVSPPLSEVAAPLGDAAGLPSGMGDFGGAGGLGGLAGGIGGVVASIIDGIGGLLGSMGDELADPSTDASAFEDPFDAEDEPEEADDAADDQSDDIDNPVDDRSDDNEAGLESPTATTDIVGGQPASDGTGSLPDELAGEPVAAEPAPAPPEPPPPPEAPPPGEATPCEIAADELPQAGR